MPCPSHPPLLDHSDYVWRGVQVMKLLIMQWKMELKETNMYWILLAQGSVQWRALVKMTMNFRLPQKSGDFLAS
jgi:hypothetical protein